MLTQDDGDFLGALLATICAMAFVNVEFLSTLYQI
jgi:hypothetical protein